MNQTALKIENYSYQDYLDIDKSTKDRVELIFGTIHMMAGASAAHQDVVGNIFYLLKNISKSKQECFPRIAPFDLKLIINEQTNTVQPDVMLFCENDENDLPCAIFEVLSPSTAYKDKTVKKDLYEQSGVQEYFLVDLNFKIIEKFMLVDKKYRYIGVYSIDDNLPIKCFSDEIEVAAIFDDLAK